MGKPVLEAVISPREKRMVSKQPPSFRDLAIKKSQLSDTIKMILSTQEQDVDEEGNPRYDGNGDPVYVSRGERLIATKLAWMQEHPESWHLDELTRAADGSKVSVDVSSSDADFFAPISDLSKDGAIEIPVLGEADKDE